MNHHYSLMIQWSEIDRCFVVLLPEFTDVYQPVTHGETYEEAVKHGQEVIESLRLDLPTRRKATTDIPYPRPTATGRLSSLSEGRNRRTRSARKISKERRR
jgi:predicted RNase H-like HicB family nuclease